MQINDRNIPFLLLISKVLKVLRIKLGFIIPTLKARLILRFLGCSYGKNLKVCGKVYFRPGTQNSITLGDHVHLTARFLTNPVGTNPLMLECIGNGRIQIGHHSGATSTTISSRTLVKIGCHVMIGGNTKIFDHDFHPLDSHFRRKEGNDHRHINSEAVIIEDDVFIGANAIILKGVHIGARSVIGAGSVLASTVIPPDSLVAGNPARIIKKTGAGHDMEK